MDKVLVIGASGQIGTSICQVLTRNGIKHLGTCFSQRISDTIPLDMADGARVHQLLDWYKPNVVILSTLLHGGVDQCEKFPYDDEVLELEGARKITCWAKSYGCRIVFLSTDYVFDGTSGPYSETDEPNPINVYGRMKLLTERLLIKEIKDIVVVRTTSVFSWNSNSRNYAMQIYDALSKGGIFRASLDIFCNPTLSSWLAETIIRIMRTDFIGIINVVGRSRITRGRFAFELARTIGLNANLILAVSNESLHRTAAHPVKAGLSTAKLSKLIGEPPLLEEMMKRFKEEMDSNLGCGR